MKRRKVLFRSNMNNTHILIITDAPQERIENWCRRYNQSIYVEPFDTLMTLHYVKILHDSEIDDNEDIEIIGFDEVYELDNYIEE